MNKGHVEVNRFVPCIEVVFSAEVQIILAKLEKEQFMTLKRVLCKEVVSIVSSSERIRANSASLEW